MDPAPVKVILDTDIGPDSDDVGTIALLNALADLGEAQLLAMVADTTCPWAAPCISALNTYYGRADVPIGTLKGNGPSGSTPDWSGITFNQQLSEKFPATYRHGAEVPCATRVLRQALAAEGEREVVLIAIGSLTNFANLLASQPDEYSSLPGRELVARSVRELVIMGGRYPSGGPECNFAYDPPATRLVVESFPAPLVFLGSEVGERLQTGPRLFTETPPTNPVREAYLLWDAHFIPRWHKDAVMGDRIWPHSSYDQATALFAVRRAGELFAVRQGRRNVVGDDGSNAWEDGESPVPHAWLELAAPAETVATVIEDLMVRQPALSR